MIYWHLLHLHGDFEYKYIRFPSSLFHSSSIITFWILFLENPLCCVDFYQSSSIILFLYQRQLNFSHMAVNQPSEFSISSSTKTIEDSLKLSRRRSILREFSLNTSTHGIPGIARSENWLNRCFWSATFLIFTGIMTYFVVGSIRAYFDYPTQTSVTLAYEWPQHYPAFTLCNLSPIRYDRFIESFSIYDNLTFTSNMTDPNSFPKNHIPCILKFFQEKINQNETITPYFFPLSSMLMKCTFNDQECSSKDFIPFTSSAYGLCYMFNARMKGVPNGGIRYSHENGGTGRLALQLYVHSHQYVPFLTEGTSPMLFIWSSFWSFVGAGIIAMVHDNTELPRIHVSGMELASGFRHRLLYRRRVDIFQSAPYSDCTNDLPLAMQAMFSYYQGTDFSYSDGICLATCIQSHK